MNKRFLVGALLVALSTTGYAFDYTHQDVQSGTSGFVGAEKGQTSFNEIKDELNRLDSTKLDKDTFYDAYNEFHLGQTFTDETLKTHREQIEDLQKENEEQAGKLDEHAGRLDGLEGQMSETLGAIQDIDRTNNLQNEKLDSIEKDLDKKVDQKEFDALAGAVEGMNTEIGNINGQLEEKVNKDEFEQATDNLQQQINKNNHISQETDKQLNNKIDEETSKLNDKIDANKAEQADKDAAQDAEIAKGDRINGVQNQQIGNLQTENVEQNNKIEALDKNKVDKNTYEEDKKAQADKDAEQDAAIALGDRVNNVQNQQIGALQTENVEQNNKIEALDKNKVDKDTYEEDKKAQADKDAAQDAEIAKGDRIDKVQNQQIGNLQSQNLEQDRNIQANKDAIAANKAEQDKVNAEQKENNEQQQAAIDKNTSDIKDHGNRLDTLENNFAQYDGRLSGLEKKVDHLDDKMNKGLSLMAAMNAVDFQNVQTGEMALGAGIGHYGNAQSVALGVAYAPVEDLTVNAKYSITAGDPDSFAVGAGATYKFKVGR